MKPHGRATKERSEAALITDLRVAAGKAGATDLVIGNIELDGQKCWGMQCSHKGRELVLASVLSIGEVARRGILARCILDMKELAPR